MDNFLRMGGVSRIDHLHLSQSVQQTFTAVRARLLWLMVCLGGGFLAGGVASAFEASLKREVALAFFLPLVVYMADAVGTQTETVLVRRLAYGEVSLGEQVATEALIGASIGLIVAVVASGGLWLWNGHPALAIVVGASLGVTAVVATVMDSLLPMGLARLEADGQRTGGDRRPRHFERGDLSDDRDGLAAHVIQVRFGSVQSQSEGNAYETLTDR